MDDGHAGSALAALIGHGVVRAVIVGRSSQGVTIFRTGKDEKVVSVERLPDSGGDDGADEADLEEGGEA